MATATKTKAKLDPNVRYKPLIKLPMLEDSGSAKVEQTEVVIINGHKSVEGKPFTGQPIIIQRGEWVEVDPEVFIVLKQKYPDL